MRNPYLALVICFAILVTMLTGCTLPEKNFISLNQEMGSLEVFESSGKIAVQFNKLPHSLTDGKQPFETALIQNMLSNFQVNIRSKADLSKQLSESSFFLVNPSTGQEKDIFTVIIKDNVFYLKVRELVNLAEALQQQELKKALEVGLGDADYISMTMEEYLTVLTGGKLPPGSMTTFINGNITERALRQQKLLLEFLEGLMNEVYDNYELGMIKQQGTRYTLTLDTTNVTAAIKPVLKYTLQNAERLGSYLKIYLLSLTPQDLALLGLPSIESTKVATEIDKLVDEAVLSREAMLQEIDKLDLEQIQSSLIPLQGSKMVLGLEKRDGEYLQDLLFNLVVSSPSDSFDIVIKSEQNSKVCGSFNVNLPTNEIVSLREFSRRLNREMQVQVDNKTYLITDYNGKKTGEIICKTNNGYTYLPMRQLAEALDETVGWDVAIAQAYVLKGGRKVYLSGLNINGTVYIKVRDFEKLGYRVAWDAETRTAIINKALL